MELPIKTIETMKHMINFNNRSRLSRSVYGRAFRTTRNSLVSKNCQELEQLVEQGYAVKSEALNMNYYYLTDEGLDLLSDILSVKIIIVR